MFCWTSFWCRIPVYVARLGVFCGVCFFLKVIKARQSDGACHKYMILVPPLNDMLSNTIYVSTIIYIYIQLVGCGRSEQMACIIFTSFGVFFHLMK